MQPFNILGPRLVALLVVTSVGCGTTDLWWYSCPDPDKGHLAPDEKTPDPCHYKDQDAGAEDAGPDAAEGCPPTACIPRTQQWEGPVWLWFGPVREAPDCPTGPSGLVEPVWEGNRDVAPGPACELCTCGPSIGSCALPSALTASTVACSQPGGTSIAFDAPMAWSGTCDSSTQIPAGMVNSLTIPPLTMEEKGCEPRLLHVPALIPPVVPADWTTLARACHGQGWLPCGGDSQAVCIPPNAPPPPGFLVCMFKEGDQKCHDPSWPSGPEVFYQEIDDKRTCSECTCEPPMGGMCTAHVYSYTDAACSLPVDPGWTISSASQKCIDIQPPGQALGSKSATPPTYLPGACKPRGGEVGGFFTPSKPVTFCCKP